MKRTENKGNRYSRVAIILHWVIAALIFANLVVGFYMEGLTGSLRSSAIAFHLSSGMTVLALTIVRVLWRLTHTPPPHSASMKPWEQHAATLAHFALYMAMVLMPLTGLSIISANPPIGSAGAASVVAKRAGLPGGDAEVRRASRTGPRMIWGIIVLPEIGILQHLGATPEGIPLQKAMHDEFIKWHAMGAFLTTALLLLHILGALKHQYLDGDAELARMGIGNTKRQKHES